jgi:hypothetical protein
MKHCLSPSRVQTRIQNDHHLHRASPPHHQEETQQFFKSLPTLTQPPPQPCMLKMSGGHSLQRPYSPGRNSATSLAQMPISTFPDPTDHTALLYVRNEAQIWNHKFTQLNTYKTENWPAAARRPLKAKKRFSPCYRRWN